MNLFFLIWGNGWWRILRLHTGPVLEAVDFHRTVLLFLFLFYLASLGFGLLDDLVLQLLRNRVVVVHFH